MAEFLNLLGGIKVIELAEGIAGPVCGLQLADLGAEVIKVEPPGGDRARGWGPPFDGEPAAIFTHLNRGKRSIVLDWDVVADRDLLRELIAEADVAIVHLDPAARDRLGIEWERLPEQQARLAVCEITGLGRRGPLAERPASELVIQAMAGFTRYAGSPDAPCRVGYEIASIGTGMAAVQAVLAMLYRRAREGLGNYCEIAMLGQLLSMKQILLAAQGDPDKWEGFHLNGPHWPADIGWQTSDGQVTFDFRHGQREGWVKFCEAVGLGHLSNDPEYEDWRSTIYIGDRKASHGTVYHAAFRTMTSQQASDLINGLGGISVKFHDYAEVVAHPQLEHLAPWVDVQGPAGKRRQVGTPFRFADALVSNPAPPPAPALGELRRKAGRAET